MSELSSAFYNEHIAFILLFGLIALAFNTIAARQGFYILPSALHSQEKERLALVHVIICFFIYFAANLLTALFISSKINSFSPSYLTLVNWLHLLTTVVTFITLLAFCYFSLKQECIQIWKRTHSSIFKDLIIGAATWFLAFPFVTVVEQFADILVYAIFNVETYEQIAVTYLKSALGFPSRLAAILLIILGTAPLIEEFLFRGVLQTWIKKHLGAKPAILIASILFALFHFSPKHGAGNLSLIPSLFAFSCFLGFIYEKRRSLLASISLHATFNLITTLRILFTDSV